LWLHKINNRQVRHIHWMVGDVVDDGSRRRRKIGGGNRRKEKRMTVKMTRMIMMKREKFLRPILSSQGIEEYISHQFTTTFLVGMTIVKIATKG